MKTKTIAQLYAASHHRTALDQNKRFGNPITTPPAHVPGVIERAQRFALITPDQAKALAKELGKISYGEWGLTIGRVGMALTKCGVERAHHMQLEGALAQ